MCLYTLDRKPKVAEEDIICYKVLEKCADGYRTPYQHLLITIPGYIEATWPIMPSDYDYYFDRKHWIVKGEGVHAYIKEGRAMLSHNFFPAVIVQCRIPKGTKYWLGDNGDIAARKMIIEEIID